MAKRSSRRKRKQDRLDGVKLEPRKVLVKDRLRKSSPARARKNEGADLVHFSFEVTDEPTETEEMKDWSDETVSLVEEVYREMHGRKVFWGGTTRKLLRLIEEHPNHLPFKNWLINLYELSGKKSKAVRLAEELFEAHPDYLFARIKLAEFLLAPGKYFDMDRAHELLGGKIKALQLLATDRSVFHVSEVIHYHFICAKYHFYENEPENFQLCKSVVEHLVNEGAGEIQFLNRLEKMLEDLSCSELDQAA